MTSIKIRLSFWIVLIGLTTACSLTAAPSSSILPTAPADSTSIPEPTPQPLPSDSMWTTGSHEGLSWREIIPENQYLARMVAVRIDPALYQFRVHYSPGEPRDLTAWQQVLPDAVAIINANFFTPEFTALGLVIADGEVYGSSYTDRGGTFAAQNGVPLLRSNITTPYAGEAFEQAVQAFPMLVENGEAAYIQAWDTANSRRSVIAVDAEGNIIFMVAPLLGLGLYDLSAFLAESDLNLMTAMNLDGGGSSLLYADLGLATNLAPFDPVPVVIAVYPK